MSPTFIKLTRLGAPKSIDVNSAVIAFIDNSGSGGSCVTFSGGERLNVNEPPDTVVGLAAAATQAAHAESLALSGQVVSSVENLQGMAGEMLVALQASAASSVSPKIQRAK